MSLTRAVPAGAGQPPLPHDLVVFLVDEDDAVRDAIAGLLQAAGHTVAAFGSGRQFLDAYRPGSPGCLVVDMDLADLDAYGLLRALAAAHAALPAIITSRQLKRREPAGGPPPGRILYLDKPFGADELLPLIRMALAGAAASPPPS